MGKEGRIKRAWDKGIVRYERNVQIRVVPPSPPTSLQTIITQKGNYNCCDFWIDVLGANSTDGVRIGWDTVELSIWVYDGQHRTLLAHKLVSDQEGVLLPQKTLVAGDRNVKALLLSVRGRPCDGFEVLAQVPASVPFGFLRFAEANVRLECWGDDSTNPNDDQGRTIVDPFAPRHKEQSKTTQMGAGDTLILTRPIGFPQSDQRVYLTHWSVYTNENTQRKITLVKTDAFAGRTDVSTVWVDMDNPSVAEYTYATRGEPAGEWLVNIAAVGGGPNEWWVNAVGFIE